MGEEIKDWIKGIADRATDPFLFALSAAWVCLDWRFLVVLFHDPAPESLTVLLDTATAQLGPHWVTPRWLDLALGHLAAICFGLAYAFGYPLLSTRIRSWRSRLKIKEEGEALLSQNRSMRTVERDGREEKLYSWKEWVKRGEIEELKAWLHQSLAAANPVKPGNQGFSYYDMRDGVLEPGFAYNTGNGILVGWKGIHPLSSIVYVFAVFPAARLALAAHNDGGGFPMPARTGSRFQVLRSDGETTHSNELPSSDYIAYVERQGDTGWGVLVVLAGALGALGQTSETKSATARKRPITA